MEWIALVKRAVLLFGITSIAVATMSSYVFAGNQIQLYCEYNGFESWDNQKQSRLIPINYENSTADGYKATINDISIEWDNDNGVNTYKHVINRLTGEYTKSGKSLKSIGDYQLLMKGKCVAKKQQF